MDEKTNEIDAMLTEAIAYGRQKNRNTTVLCEALKEIRRLSLEVKQEAAQPIDTIPRGVDVIALRFHPAYGCVNAAVGRMSVEYAKRGDWTHWIPVPAAAFAKEATNDPHN